MMKPYPSTHDRIPLRLFREAPEDEGEVVVLDEDRPEEEKERKLRCRACGNGITDRSQRFAKGGQHRHTFFNPAGVVYELGCFHSAPGCATTGEASGEFSWFAGYVWRIVVCAGCHTHLGWQFSSGDDLFYGLILSRLVEGED